MNVPSYHPRNVFNAPVIKERIVQRSAERSDPADIAAWLKNHFYRHIIGNFSADAPAVQAIDNARKLAQKPPFSATQPPAWARRVLQRLEHHAAKGWWMDPDSPAVLALEARVLEFLHSRQGTALEGKLQRITCPQALARWTLEHWEFAQQRERGRIVHQANAVRPLLRCTLGSFFEFDPKSTQLRLEMAYESQMMRHCLGQFADRKALTGGYGESYASACEAGHLRLFSYRHGTHPHITISARVLGDGRLRLEEIKGKQNRPPIERYHTDLLHFLNHLNSHETTPPDALDIGVVRRPDALCHDGRPAWCPIRDLHSPAEHLWLLQHHPHLLGLQHLQTPLLQWLAATRRDDLPDDLLEHMPRSPALQQALTLAHTAIQAR